MTRGVCGMVAVATALILGACATPVNAEVESTSVRLSMADSAKRAEVVRYLDQIFVHGVPYDYARELGPEAVPILEAYLDSDSHHVWRSTIVATIAFLAGRRAFPILRRFTWERFHGEVDLSTFQALTATQSVLGAVQGSEAVEYLAKGTNPDSWKGIPWSFGTYHGEKLHLLMSKVAINGLGLTGTARAAEVLEKLRRHPFAPQQLSNINEALPRNEEVRKIGLAEYLRRRDSVRR
jgi:hypothetical protein